MKTNVSKHYKKYGITMMTLVITIIVSLIMVSVVTVTVSNSIADATLTAFAEDLNTIQDQVNIYYLQNDSFPTGDSEENQLPLTRQEILDRSGDSEKLQEEFNLNNEDNSNEFFEIDLSKLNVEKTVRGTRKNDDNSDVYVVSSKTMTVYYLKGIEVKNTRYFSLSSKIIKYVKMTTENQEDTSGFSYKTVGTITAKIANKSWTNKLGITLNAYIESEESLYLSLAGGQEKYINTNTGNNIIIYNTVDDVKAKVTDVTDNDIIEFNKKTGNEKYIEIIKKNSNGETIDSLKIDLSNVDNIFPSNSQITLKENQDENVLTFNVTDNESGIKQVRYEYLKRYNSSGIEEDYYAGVEELAVSYIKQKGKKAIISDSENSSTKNVEIKVPKEISKIAILVIDNSGNCLLVKEDIKTDFYIGSTLETINENGALFKVAFNNNLGISSYSVQISVDGGKNYTSKISKSVNLSDKTYSEVISNYKEGIKITNNLYIKITAVDNNTSTSSRVTKERIVKYSLSDAKSGNYIGDNIVDMINGVPIPKGFVASSVEGENSKTDGLVIYEGTDPVNNSNVETARTTRNQYVWIPVNYNDFKREIPVYDSTTQTIKWLTNVNGINVEGSWQENTTTSEYIEMSESIKKYGGFYIGRYEAGIPNNVERLEQGNDSDSKSRSLALCNQGVRPVSIQQANVWNYIPWGTKNNSTTDFAKTDPIDGKSGDQTADGAVKASRLVYPNVERLSQYGLSTKLTNNTGVISTLCYAICRDSVLKFISDVKNPDTGGMYITDSNGMGWYTSNFVSNWYLKTGVNVNTAGYNKVKNIYDLGGNVLEWTMEGIDLDGAKMYRRTQYGGSYMGYSLPSQRVAAEPFEADKKNGFRVMLYIK